MTDRTYVYAVLAQESRRIKIGVTNDPNRRLASLQTGSPERLELIGAAPGDRFTEARLHAELQHDRLLGEWFASTDRVIRVCGDFLGWDKAFPTPQQLESAKKAAALRIELADSLR